MSLNDTFVSAPEVQDSSYINPFNLIKILNGASQKDQIYFPSSADAEVKLEYGYNDETCVYTLKEEYVNFIKLQVHFFYQEKIIHDLKDVLFTNLFIVTVFPNIRQCILKNIVKSKKGNI